MSITPGHIPLEQDPEELLGKSGLTGGGLLGRLTPGTSAAGLPAEAELALGRQFLMALEGELGEQGQDGSGSGMMSMLGIAGADLTGKGVMSELYRALQEMAMRQDGDAGAVKSADAGKIQPGQAFDIQAGGREGDSRGGGVEAALEGGLELRQEQGAAEGSGAAGESGAAKSWAGISRAAEAYLGPVAKSLAGFLSARFESGADPGKIGYDRVGGTSYGSFQIASRTGTMDRFLNFLDDKDPETAKRLRAAGSTDTGSRQGAMPEAWKELAEEDPEGFFGLQYDFIRKSHFEPAARFISEQTGVDLLSRAPALAEVLFSTSVQHGATGSANIFSQALEKAMGLQGADFDTALIKEVYKTRAGQFSSSTSEVRQAVKARLAREESAALSMLRASRLLDASV